MPVSEHDIFFVFRISLIQDQPSMIVTCIVKVAFTMAHCSILIPPLLALRDRNMKKCQLLLHTQAKREEL